MSEREPTNNTLTFVEDQAFTMERIFDAPRELVFKMFTKPEHVARWWAPTDYTIPVCKIDLRQGGEWHYCMESPEGERHWVKAVYHEVIEPEKFSYTSTFVDQDGNPIEDLPEHLGTVILTEYEDKTKLEIRIQLETAEALKTMVNTGMIEGLTLSFNNLETYLKEN